MQIVMFYPSVVCGGEHGTGHFVRGVVRELIERGHTVRLLESATCGEQGDALRAALERRCPGLETGHFDARDLWPSLRGADLVIVHEQVGLPVARQVGEYRLRARGYRLLLHAGTGGTPPQAQGELEGYDGVLNGGDVRGEAFGGTLPIWSWPAAVDSALFGERRPDGERDGDVLWVGHWAAGRRARQLRELFIDPVEELGLRGGVCGGGYPLRFRRTLEEAGIDWAGVVANDRLPDVLARYRTAIHLEAETAEMAEASAELTGGGGFEQGRPVGVPMRVLEALASGVPVVIGGVRHEPRWALANGMRAGVHFAQAADAAAMARTLRAMMEDGERRRELAAEGRAIVMAGHTCEVRTDRLLHICHNLGVLGPYGRTRRPLAGVGAKGIADL